MPQYKLGKQSPKRDPRTFQLGSYLKPAITAPPATQDWTTKVKAPWEMMGNDTYGDCTCAAAGHMVMTWTANQSKEVVVPTPDIIKFYDHFSGGNPDAGANMLDVLNYWRRRGLDSHKITAFMALQPRSHVEAQDAINLFGACYIGVALPDFAVPAGVDFLTIPWQVPPQGPVGNAAPDPNNGHCIPAFAYDQHNLYVVTWGAVKSMSWEFYDAYMDEAYAVLSPDWATPEELAPNGLNAQALLSDLQSIDQAVPQPALAHQANPAGPDPQGGAR